MGVTWSLITLRPTYTHTHTHTHTTARSTRHTQRSSDSALLTTNRHYPDRSTVTQSTIQFLLVPVNIFGRYSPQSDSKRTHEPSQFKLCRFPCPLFLSIVAATISARHAAVSCQPVCVRGRALNSIEFREAEPLCTGHCVRLS